MAGKRKPSSDNSPPPLALDDLILTPQIHYLRKEAGDVLTKSGQHLIRLHVQRAADSGVACAAILGAALGHTRFVEETFGYHHQPSSVFNAFSPRLICLVPDVFRKKLHRHLFGKERLRSRRSAKILSQIHARATTYPDARTLLHCLFQVDGMGPTLFTAFARHRFQQTTDPREVDLIHYRLREDLLQARVHFMPLIGAIGSRATRDGQEFCNAAEILELRLASAAAHRLAAIRKMNRPRNHG